MSRFPLRDDRSGRRRLPNLNGLQLGDAKARPGRWPVESSPNGHLEGGNAHPPDPPGPARGPHDGANNSLPAGAGPDDRIPGPAAPVPTGSAPTDSAWTVSGPVSPTEVVGLTGQQKEEVIQLVTAGIGRAACARQLQVTLADIDAAIAGDPGFAARVATAESACTDDCMTMIYEAGMQGNVSACVAHVKLTNDRQASEERLRQSGKLVDHATTPQSMINMSVLSNQEFALLGKLKRRLDSGETLDADATLAWGALSIKMMGRQPPPDVLPESQGFSEDLKALASIERPTRSLEDMYQLYGIDND